MSAKSRMKEIDPSESAGRAAAKSTLFVPELAANVETRFWLSLGSTPPAPLAHCNRQFCVESTVSRGELRVAIACQFGVVSSVDNHWFIVCAVLGTKPRLPPAVGITVSNCVSCAWVGSAYVFATLPSRPCGLTTLVASDCSDA